MLLREKIKQFAVRQRAIRDLNALDDRALKDVGLSRGEIKAAVLGRL